MPSLCSGMSPGVAGYGVMLAAGGMIAIAVEWVAVHLLGRWTYTAYMPMIPVLDIGLVPLLQMLILPPSIFYIAAAWASRFEKLHRQARP
jgi:hypothetical protein